jgi:Restriction endonuclease
MSPMLTQYLVGLCCLKHHPDAVKVTLGDMLFDEAACKDRDVDVTVTIDSDNGDIETALFAFEVKKERKPLDVAVVEQIALKLADMPTVRTKGIVSASGFTKTARNKARAHGIELLELKPWTSELREKFPAYQSPGTPKDVFRGTMLELFWVDAKLELVAPTAAGAFVLNDSDPLFDKKGRLHKRFQKFSEYKDAVLLKSTQALFAIEPAQTILRTFPIPYSISDGSKPGGPPWPHTHTLDVTADDVFPEVNGTKTQLMQITISGYLQWQRHSEAGDYYVIENCESGDAFAAALVFVEVGEGRMTCLVFSPQNRDVSVEFVRLNENHLNAIRQLQLKRQGTAHA